jgi:tetratricopeptide (TPR) repeat protein
MGKQWVREQVRHDEVQEAAFKGAHWLKQNRTNAGIGAGVVAALLLGTGFFLYSRNARENAAWEKLALAQAQFYSGNVEIAAKQATEAGDEFAGTSGGAYALLFAGDVHFIRSNFQQSVAEYAKVLAQARPEAALPLAQGGTALAYEADGKCPQAAGAADAYLQSYPDHFLAPQVHAALARCQLTQGQAEAARASLQKISLQYPETSWASWAQGKLNPAKK